MNPLLRWLTSPEWAHVVAALLHSLWQGAVVALALAVLMRRLTNPLTRYRCALSALAVIGSAGIVTWALLNAPDSALQPSPTTAIEPTIPAITSAAFDSNPNDKVIVIGQMTRPAAPPNWTAWLALTWLAGAMVMLLRAGIKVAGAEKLRRSCQPLADEPIAALVAEACRAVGLARKIRVAVTDRLTSPAVVGVLVPTLILPLSLFTTLTPTQIQFVLLHELAHIRRGDYLANLFQLFAEALLFFNPAVWWISHQIRREREACCDALAIELSGAPADYARTLVRVAENILQPAPAAAPAFGDDGREPSSLADRVQRLVVPGYRPTLRLTWRAMLTSLLFGGALLVLSAVGTRNTVGAILTSSQPTTAPVLQRTRINSEEYAKVPEDDSAIQTKNIPDLTDFVGYDLTTAATFVPTPVTLASVLPLPIFRVRQVTNNVDKVPVLGDLPGIGKLFTSESSTARQTWFSGDESFSASNWTVGGQKQTNQQWFWYRTGGTTYATQVATPAGKISNDLAMTEATPDANGETSHAESPIKENPPDNPPVTANSFNRLNKIRLENVHFQRLTLREVARELEAKTEQADPEKLGVSIRIEPQPAPIDPATGLPLHMTTEELESVLVTFRYRISAPLKSILDQVVSCASKPIKYTFTNNTVRFSLRGANESEPLFTREFDLPARTLYGKILTNLTQTDINRTASSNLAPMALEGFRTWLKGIGVNLDPKQGKALYYKDQKGILLARATLAELDVIEVAIVNLNHPATALDSYTFQLEPTTIARAIETQFPQFKPVTATNVAAGLRALLESTGADLSPPKTIFYNDRAGGLFVRATPQELDAIEELLQVIGQQPPQVNIKAVFVEIPFGKTLPKELAKILGPITQAHVTNFAGILTAPQFKVILRAVESSADAKIVAMPQVTTLSGRQAQIQVTDVKTIVSGMTAVVTNGLTNLVYQSQAMPFGPVLDVLPTVSGDGYTIQMTLSPTITEFLGYEDAKKLKLSSPDDKGTLPLPIIRTRQMTTSASVWDGQTIVLGNFSDQMLDAPPDLKGAPKGSAKRQSKQLLVFITPTIIDPAGNPANKDMGIPSRLTPDNP